MVIMRPPQQGQECFGLCGSAALGLIALMASTGMIGGMSSPRIVQGVETPVTQGRAEARAEPVHPIAEDAEEPLILVVDDDANLFAADVGQCEVHENEVGYTDLPILPIVHLARPTRNVTSLFLQQIELAKKRVQILKDGLPDAQTATMFWDSPSEDQWKATNEVAGAFGLQLAGIELREQPYDYEAALAQAPPDHRSVLIMPTSPVFYHDRERLAELALRHRIASIFVLREWVDAGGLLSYGASFPAMFRRAAEYVDRIAKGAKAGDLPVEQPTKFELVLNLKTARAIGITISPAILVRADEVIE
jgi:ABC transporter substrate binding protein